MMKIRKSSSSNERGTTLIETMIAVFVAMVGVFSLGGVIFQATVTSKNEGTEVTRATIYTQDKMETLLSLDVNACTQLASVQPAACNTTGITDPGYTQGLLAGGIISPIPSPCPSSGPLVGYLDYLDSNGLQITGPCTAVQVANPAYMRQWQITDITPNGPGAPTIKNITVAVYAQAAINTGIGKPIVVLTSNLSNPN